MKFRLNSLTVQLYVDLPKICCHKDLFQFDTEIYENLQVLMT